ncbi:MAG: hypothetical protein VYC34_06600 [Planctomycetota bacterium]|nr:hypothetical protein [Planctomycetota bacterium]
MKKRSRYAGLLVLNAALIAAMAVVTVAPVADAQSRRARGEYTMVAGEVQGMTESAIYIIDNNNAELVAVRWDQSRKQLAPVGFRDLDADARAQGGSR